MASLMLQLNLQFLKLKERTTDFFTEKKLSKYFFLISKYVIDMINY